MAEIIVPIEPPCCRICHLSSPESRGVIALRTLNILCPKISSSTELKENDGDCLIPLGCSCRGEMALAHYSCALRWFVRKNNTICEVCKNEAINVKQADVENISRLVSSYQEGSWASDIVLRALDVSLRNSRAERESIELTTIPATPCSPHQDASLENNSDATCSGAHEHEMEPMSAEAVNETPSEHKGEEDSAHVKFTGEEMEKRISDYVDAMNWFDSQDDAVSFVMSPGHIFESEGGDSDDWCFEFIFYTILSILSFSCCYVGPICLVAFILAVSFGRDITNYGLNYILGWVIITLLVAFIIWRSCRNAT